MSQEQEAIAATDADSKPLTSEKPKRKPFITKENAAEIGRLGGLKKKAPRGEEWLRQKAQNMTGELVAAAMGEGRWKALPLDKQFAALLKVLEYGFGKPATAKKVDEPDKQFDMGLPTV